MSTAQAAAIAHCARSLSAGHVACQPELGEDKGVLALVEVAKGGAAHGGVGVGTAALEHVVAAVEEVGAVL